MYTDAKTVVRTVYGSTYSHASISMLSFHSLSFLIRSSSVSAFTARSSVYNNSHVKATVNSLDKASMTITISKRINAEHTDLYLITIAVTINFS